METRLGSVPLSSQLEDGVSSGDFLNTNTFPASTSSLDGALARDVAALEVELERARVLVAVSSNGFELKNMSEVWRADRLVVLAAVRQCGQALRFASTDLVRDSEIVRAAVLADPWALQFAPQQFEGAKQIVIGAVQQDGGVLEFLDETFKRDPEVIFHALYGEVWRQRHSVDGMKVDSRGLDGSAAPAFWRHADSQVLDRLMTAVAEYTHSPRCSLGFPDFAAWVDSKLARRAALLLVHRGDAFGPLQHRPLLRSAIAASVLEFL